MDLPDGFLMTGCQTVQDCDDNDPCTVDSCDAISHVCSFKAKNCISSSDDCNTGMCDPTNMGACVPVPANEGMNCSDRTGADGTCRSGTCVPLPTCSVDTYLYCPSSVQTGDTSTFTNQISTYTCAGTGTYDGPEVSFPLYVTHDGPITITLTGLSADLDLLLLTGTSCTSRSDCVMASTNSGTADETITFNATTAQQYYVVIDGKAGASSSFTLDMECARLCTPKVTPILGCNMTVMGDTSTSTALTLNNTVCTSANISGVPDVGPEDVYALSVPADGTRFRVTASGFTQDLDLQVIGAYTTTNPDCTDFCAGSSYTTGTGQESTTFTTYTDETFFVVVDSRTSTGGPYQLDVLCPASCENYQQYMSCYTPGVLGRNDAATSTDKIDSWACAPNTTGHEYIYYFSPSAAGDYTFTLTGMSDDLDLILMETSTFMCDPTMTCKGSSTNHSPANADESITATLSPSYYYFLAVDGYNGASSAYSLKVQSTACPTPNCYTHTQNILSCSYLTESRRNDDVNRGSSFIDSYGSCATNETGPEIIYSFTPTTTGSYTATITGLTADLDLIVLAQTTAGQCDATQPCVASSTTMGTSDETVTFSATAGKTYYIAVDGKAGAVSPYNITFSGTKTGGGNACNGPTCTESYNDLNCATALSVNSANDYYTTSTVSTWGTTTSCATNESGPESAHKFQPPADGDYTFELTSLKADLDLIVIEADASGNCNAAATSCVGASTNTGTTPESLTVTLSKSKTYYIMVDGKNGATSPYVLLVSNGC
jgi:hypothetical protein